MSLPYEDHLKSLLIKAEVIQGTIVNPDFLLCVAAYKPNGLSPLWQTLGDFAPDSSFTVRHGMAHLIKCMTNRPGWLK